MARSFVTHLPDGFIDLFAVVPCFARQRCDGVMKIGRDREPAMQRLVGPFPEPVEIVHLEILPQPAVEGMADLSRGGFGAVLDLD